MNRYKINFNVKGKLDCVICNPIKPCYDSSICEDCLKWLQNNTKESPTSLSTND